MRLGSRTTLLHVTAILGSVVPLSSGASIPRDADPGCTYPTGKFSLGHSKYLGLDDTFKVFVATDAAHAVPLQLNYCGKATGDSNTFEIAVTDGKGSTLGLLGSVGQPQLFSANAPWNTSDVLLAIVNHTAPPQTGSYSNTAIPLAAASGEPTSSQIWMYDMARRAPYFEAHVVQPIDGMNIYILAVALAALDGFSLTSNTGSVAPLFISTSTAPGVQYSNLSWVQDPPPPPPTVPDRGQCGGAGYEGLTQCGAGLACVGKFNVVAYTLNESYCLSFDNSSCPSSTNGTQQLYDMCGSSEDVHHRQCKPGTVCISTNSELGSDLYGSRCLPLDANSTVPCS